MDTDELRPAHVEREAGHDVDGVGATHADGDHAETAGIRGVAVGADHHAARERVLLEHDLVDDARAGAPEADAVLGGDRLEKVVHLLVALLGGEEVGLRADLGLNEVVAVNGGRHGHLREPSGHEL